MKLNPRVEQWRITEWGPWSSFPGDLHGAFVIPGPLSRDLKVLASPGSDIIPWEHVSVSAKKTCPTWVEMSFVKDLFFDPEEAVMQLHPPRSTWVNNHDTCLHLWRPLEAAIPLPPSIAVGVRE